MDIADVSTAEEKKKAAECSAAGVVGFSEIEMAFHGQGDLGTIVAARVGGRCNDLLGGHVVYPCTGQIPATHACIFDDVAGNVGKLHGNAEVDGMSLCSGVLVVENLTHQQAHRSCDFVCVLDERFFVGEQHFWSLVVHETFNQRSDHVGG